MIVLKGLAFIVDFIEFVVDFIISVSVGLICCVFVLFFPLYVILFTISNLILLPWAVENKDEEILEQLKQLVKDEKYIKKSCFALIMWRLPVQILYQSCLWISIVIDFIDENFDNKYNISLFRGLYPWVYSLFQTTRTNIDIALEYRLGKDFSYKYEELEYKRFRGD